MTTSTIQVESSNMQNILIAIVVICAIVYGFIEFRKINNRFQELEELIGKMHKSMSTIEQQNSLSDTQSNTPSNTQSNTSSNTSSSVNTRKINSLPKGISKTSNKKETEVNKSTTEQDEQDEIIQPEIQMNSIESDELYTELENPIQNDELKQSNDIMNTIISDVDGDIKNNIPMMGGLFISVETSVDDKLNVDNLEEGNLEEGTIEEVIEDNKDNERIEDITMNLDDTLDLEIGKDTSSKYEEYTIKELKEKLTELGLATSGNKTKLIQRIVANE